MCALSSETLHDVTYFTQVHPTGSTFPTFVPNVVWPPAWSQDSAEHKPKHDLQHYHAHLRETCVPLIGDTIYHALDNLWQWHQSYMTIAIIFPTGAYKGKGVNYIQNIASYP